MRDLVRLAAKTQQHDELNEKHDELKEKNARLRDEKLELFDELRHVKNLPRRPKIKPSGLHPKPKSGTVRVDKRKPERKTITIKVPDVPEGSSRDGYKT